MQDQTKQIRNYYSLHFALSRRRREMYCGHTRLCMCVCLSVCGHMPTLLHGPGRNLGAW